MICNLDSVNKFIHTVPIVRYFNFIILGVVLLNITFRCCVLMYKVCINHILKFLCLSSLYTFNSFVSSLVPNTFSVILFFQHISYILVVFDFTLYNCMIGPFYSSYSVLCLKNLLTTFSFFSEYRADYLPCILIC